MSTLPAANLAFPIGTIHGDRLWFTATAGVALWIGALSRSLPTPIVLAAMLAWSVGHGAVIVDHVPTFASDRALVAAAERDPGDGAVSGRTHYVYARLAAADGDTTTAGRHLAIAVQLDPDLGAAWNDLGLRWLADGERDKARDAFVVGTAARDQDDDTRYVLHKNLASLGVVDGALDAARAALTRCLAIDPDRLVTELGPLFDDYESAVSDAWLAETLDVLEAAAGAPAVRAGLTAQRGRLAYRRGRFADAVDLCRASLPHLTAGWITNECRIWLAASLIERGRHAEARPVLDAIDAATSADEDQRERSTALRALLPG